MKKTLTWFLSNLNTRCAYSTEQEFLICTFTSLHNLWSEQQASSYLYSFDPIQQ